MHNKQKYFCIRFKTVYLNPSNEALIQFNNNFNVNDKFSALQHFKNARLNDDRRLASRVRRPNTRVVEQIRVGRSVERANPVEQKLTRKTPPTRRFRNVPGTKLWPVGPRLSLLALGGHGGIGFVNIKGLL